MKILDPWVIKPQWKLQTESSWKFLKGATEQWGNHKLRVSRAASSPGFPSGEGNMVASNTWAAGFYHYSLYWWKFVPYIFITYAVHPKGNQSWIFIGRTDAEAEAETPILWPPDVKNWHMWKDPDAGKDWRQEEKGTTEDEMVGWHQWLNGHEFE